MRPLADIVLYLANEQYVRQSVLVAEGFSEHDLESLREMKILSRRIGSYGLEYQWVRYLPTVSLEAQGKAVTTYNFSARREYIAQVGVKFRAAEKAARIKLRLAREKDLAA